MNTKGVVIVTPAGRERYLRLLHEHLARQRADFDRWQLWLNTHVASDVQYIESLGQTCDWIDVIRPDEPVTSVDSNNIHQFFRFAREPETVYIRLDDDVVYLCPGFVKTLSAFRRENPRPFLVFGNIINNAVVSHIHQRNMVFEYPNAKCGYGCMDNVGWKDPHLAHSLHDAFLKDLEKGSADDWKRSFRAWHLWDYERVSINCISWLGSDMPEHVAKDEEKFLAVEHPKSIGRPNVILGAAVCAHFGFYTQRAHLDATDVLQRYSDFAAATHKVNSDES